MSTGDGVVHNTGIAMELGGNTEDFQSGSTLDIQSGATQKVEGTIAVKTGGVVNYESGSALQIAGVDVTAAVGALANATTDNQQIVGINEVILETSGTWTKTRIAEADYSLRHTAAANTSILGIDVTKAIRTGASKGLKLASIDVLHEIGTAALLAHTATLDKIAYANNVANAVTSIPLTGSLSTATQAQPYVDNLAITTPAYDNTADSKYIFELTVQADTTSAYDYYGIVLKFTQSQS
jgi:hypothetical protein